MKRWRKETVGSRVYRVNPQVDNEVQLRDGILRQKVCRLQRENVTRINTLSHD